MIENALRKYRIPTIIIILIATSILRAAAVSFFFLPNNIANGGASGIATILSNHIKIFSNYQGVISLIINIPLIILAFFYLNRWFVFMTLIATGLTSGFTQLFQFIVNNNTGFILNNQPFVAAIAGGILWGVALGFLLKINCSTGGSDIVGLLLQNKFPNAKVVWVIFSFDCMIGILGGMLHTVVTERLGTAIYAIVAIFGASFIADIIQRGMIATVEFKIITDKHQEIADYIIKDLHRGITAFKATGMYTRSDKYFLVCVVRKRQVQLVKAKIREIDPMAFFYFTGVNDISGSGFDNTLTPSSKIK